MSLVKLLRARRKKLKMTIFQVAEGAGTCKSHIWAIEHDNHIPSLALADELAEVLLLNLSDMADAIKGIE